MTNIYSCRGDSGGPLFSESDHRAYGIRTHGLGDPCSATVSFSPLSKIFSASAQRAQLSFSLTPR